MTKDELLLFRRSLKLDQKAFGAALGVSRQAVSNWENGKFSVPGDIVAQLAAKGIGTLKPLSTSEQKETARKARGWADAYAEMRRPPHNWSHAQVVERWIADGHLLRCPREALAVIASEWPEILETANQGGN